MRSVELFAGAGGLAIGMTKAGFQHVAVIEKDAHACRTFRENQRLHGRSVEDWKLHEIDARSFDYGEITAKIDVVSGGPPCQPFSMGGKHRGRNDSRDMFPEAVRAVRELMPQAFIFENVRGLMREAFASYFRYVYLQLCYPDLTRHNGEVWNRHLSRLEQHHTSSGKRPPYKVIYRVLNAADYGVPQKRQRVFIVGIRADLGVDYSFPEPTHSAAELYRAMWVTGEYWDQHKIPRRKRPTRTLKASSELPFAPVSRWRTVRDAIADLPDPADCKGVANHVFVPGARSYAGHTGSTLDEPAKTLKAGGHGVPGGENMLRRPNGSVRYFSVREAARLQSFPDEFVFLGSWTETMRQLGNAVPVDLAFAVAKSVRKALQRKALPEKKV